MTQRLSARPRPPVSSAGALVPAFYGFFPFCWVVYLVATPFYVFDPGYPQPADALMALMILILLTGYGLRLPTYPSLYLVAVLFLGHVAIVNWFWWTQYKDLRFMLSSLYYLYNFGVFLLTVSLLRKYGANVMGISRAGLMIAAMVVLLFCLVNVGGGRVSGTFNNPNQLGYWSLLAVACFLALKGDERLRLPDLVFLGTATYLTALSLSRAAMLALFALLVAALIGHGIRRLLQPAVVVVLLALVPLLVVQTEGFIDTTASQSTVANVADRLESTGQRRHDSFEARGYDRLWLYPEYLILGAGEGGFHRFSLSKSVGLEIHSTVATLLFSYGMVGFALISATVYMMLRKAPWRHIMYFGIISFYGLTHQGLRFTLLWVFLGLVYGLATYVYPSAPKGGARARPAVARLGPGENGTLRPRVSRGTAR